LKEIGKDEFLRLVDEEKKRCHCIQSKLTTTAFEGAIAAPLLEVQSRNEDTAALKLGKNQM
jgi:sulfite reductase (ferredoxin)